MCLYAPARRGVLCQTSQTAEVDARCFTLKRNFWELMRTEGIGNVISVYICPQIVLGDNVYTCTACHYYIITIL